MQMQSLYFHFIIKEQNNGLPQEKSSSLTTLEEMPCLEVCKGAV